MKKHQKIKFEDVIKLKNTNKKEYYAVMKKKLFGDGLKCMIVSMVMLLLLYFLLMENDVNTMYLPLKFFDFMKTFVKITFTIGSISCILSFTYKKEDNS